MSRSNGPPNQPPAWPTSRPQQSGQPGNAPQGQGYDVYDPYYTQAPQQGQPAQPAPQGQPRAPAQTPYSTAPQQMTPQPAALSSRQPRIQAPTAAPPARSPQHGLPPVAYAPQQQQAYVPPSQPVSPTQGYPSQTYPAQPAAAAPYPGQQDPRFTAPSPYDAPQSSAYRQPAYQPTFHPVPSFEAGGQGGYGQPPQARPPSAQPQAWQAPGSNDYDAQGYNLDSYAPTQNSQRPGDLVATPRTAPPAWTPSAADSYGDPRTQPTRQPQRDAPNYAEAPSFAPPAYSQPSHAQALEPAHDDEEYDEALEEEAPRRRWGLIAASLVGAIALGGGLAYGYKAFVAAPAQVAGVPQVKAGSSPVKVKPADPGGTKFANTDSKMMESLSGSQATTSENGTRAVQTMTIGRDGSIAAGSPSAPPGPPVAASSPPTPQAAAASLATATPVPGMTLILPPSASGPRPQQAQAAAPALPQAAPVPPKAVAPKVIAAASPAALEAVEAPASQVKKVAVPVKKTAPAAVGAPGAGGNGFVAVLASVPVSGSSRVAAMQQYADLQQKYGGALANKAPDVVEATTEKGAYHRLVVGPPASREAAGSVCTQLKAAGYTKDCWVTAF